VRLLLLVLIAGCGRVYFDDRVDAQLGPYPDADPSTLPSGLVAWWPLDDDPSGGSTRDASGNGHTAVCTRCPTRVAGARGGAFDFQPSRNHLFRVPDDGSFRLTAGFTVMNWVYLRSRVLFSSFSKATGGDSGDSWEIAALAPGMLAFNTGLVPNVDVGAPIAEDRWVHIAGTWDPSGVKQLLIDGQIVATWNARTNSFDDHDVLLGGEEDASGAFTYLHEGLLDDVQIYSRALADNEIRSVIEQ
jgi:hypothetical protein